MAAKINTRPTSPYPTWTHGKAWRCTTAGAPAPQSSPCRPALGHKAEVGDKCSNGGIFKLPQLQEPIMGARGSFEARFLQEAAAVSASLWLRPPDADPRAPG
ncbi:hypothetical protein GUJ93_ZPchr0012g21382 [Zizania palustris]|uniref:Uncharacterized protein n=1 Tax=Zizania palustris TaxID=103762 RepID=A0A8J6BNE7_ZIZPA|nr:hypothetical protein GUJ93_ZPchr0012g21382 [Zizania palustris]